jgi:hypothetical protein
MAAGASRQAPPALPPARPLYYQRMKEGSALLTMLPASLRKGRWKVTGS